MAAAPQKTKAMWAKAAQSIANVSGLEATVADVLHARVLRVVAEGLRQYLTIRLGNEELANSIYLQVKERVTAWSADEMLEAPGGRARIYKLARDLADSLRDRADGDRPKHGTLPFFVPVPALQDSYGGRLTRIRKELASEDAELLELRHARELLPEEIALVVGLDIAEVERRLEGALARATEILGPEPPSRLPGVPGAIIEAFALIRTRGEDEEYDPNAEREPLAPETVLGERYSIDARVGTGAFGDVYRARDTEVPGHVVALKLLHQPALSETARSAALRELRLIASVFHPSVVSFKDHGWHDGRLWFVMPWYEGETLEARIGREPLTRAQARRIFEPLARALAAMHAAGIRHQDIKPDNVFLVRMRGIGFEDAGHDILPVLIDLGVAAKEAEMLLAGTPTYFAPEVAAQFAQMDARRNVTMKADVFSLALALRNALEPDTQDEVPGAAVEAFIAHRAEHVPPLPEGKDLRYLAPTLKRWLATDPDDRPSADVLADELAVLTQPEDRRARRTRILRAVLPIAALLLGLFASVVYVLSNQTELQRLETLRAQQLAREQGSAVQRARARQRSLEADMAKMSDDYEQSTLTRSDLAQRLARTEAEATELGSELTAAQQTVRALREARDDMRKQLGDVRAELATTTRRVTELSAELDRARTRSSDLAGQLEIARTRSAQLERDVGEARTRAQELASQLEAARSANNAAEARANDLERRLGAAEAARERAEQEAAELRRRLAAAGGGGGNEGGGEQPPPPPPPPQ